MATCLITGGITADCADIRKVGGLAPDIYLGNVSELLASGPYTVGVDGYVEALNFDTGGALYKIEGLQYAHASGYTAQVQEGANAFYQHELVFKALPGTPAEDQVLEKVLAAQGLFAVVQTNSGDWQVLGINLGMRQTEGSQNSGTAAASDTADVVTLQGQDTVKPKRFFISDANTTRTTIEGYLTPAA